MVFLTNTSSRFASVVLVSILGPPYLALNSQHLMGSLNSVVSEAKFEARVRAFEGCCVSSNSPSRVRDGDKLLGGTGENIVSLLRVH